MRRRRLLIAGLAVAAAGAGVGTAWWRRRDADAHLADEHLADAHLADADIGNAHPAELWRLRFAQPGGGELRLETLKGRPLLLNFWATWCPPCVGELPLLDQFARAQPRWQVIGLAVDQLQPVRDFLAQHVVSFPIGMAGLDGVDLSRRLGNHGGGLPFTLVFDSRGAVAGQRLGALSAHDLEGWRGAIE